MIKMADILGISKAIYDEFNPDKIILFGSYAYGNPQDDSDIDLLVIMPYKGNVFRKTWEILNKIQPKFAVDILIRTPREIEQHLAWNDFFLQEIMQKGKVLYESTNDRVD
jgi:predicted nucleotidyltransferase